MYSCNRTNRELSVSLLTITGSVNGVPGRMVKGTNGFSWELPRNLSSLPRNAGFAVMDSNGKMNLRRIFDDMVWHMMKTTRLINHPIKFRISSNRSDRKVGFAAMSFSREWLP